MSLEFLNKLKKEQQGNKTRTKQKIQTKKQGNSQFKKTAHVL